MLAGAESMLAIVELLLVWIVRSCAGGIGSLRVEAARVSRGNCRIRLRAANTDPDLHEGVGREVAASELAADDSPKTALLVLAANLCRSKRGRFNLTRLGEDRWLAQVELELPCAEPVQAGTAPLGAAVEAWLVGQPPHALEHTTRRLRRLGWRVRLFGDAAQALDRIAHGPAEAAPHLVIGVGHLGVSRASIARLRHAMPRQIRVAWAVDVGHRRSRVEIAGVHRCPWPLSEARLRAFTDDARTIAAPTAGPDMRPRPPRVLVMDAAAASRCTARAVFEVLGYDTELAADGVEGLDRSLTTEPDLDPDRLEHAAVERR